MAATGSERDLKSANGDFVLCRFCAGMATSSARTSGLRIGVHEFMRTPDRMKDENGIGRGTRPLRWDLALELAHALGEKPQGTIEAYVLVDALYGSGTLASAIRGTAQETAPHQILLGAVEHAPEVGVVVVEAPGCQQLVFADRRRLVRVVVLECKCGVGKYLSLTSCQGDRLHGIARGCSVLKAIEYLVGTFDHRLGHVALVGYPHIRHRVATDKTVLADKAKHARQHLIAAAAIVGVEEDDFVGLTAVDLARMAQADHVLGELAPVVLPHAGLGDHERLEPLLTEFAEHGGGGDVAVSLGAALVLGLGKDGRSHGANLVIREGMVGPQDWGVGCETGCKHVGSPDKKLLLTHHRIPRFGARLSGCPVGSARRPGPVSLPPSFLSSSPATVRSARTGAVKEESDKSGAARGESEDTAWRALTAHGRKLQSRT